MIMLINSLIVAIAAILLAAQAYIAEAYVTHGRWSSNQITMRASSVSFPSGSSYRTALQTVANRYFNNPSQMWFSQLYDDTSVSFNNGQSEVWFTSDSSYSPAWTFWWYDFWTGKIKEADIVFYNGVSYTTSMTKTSLWPYGGASRPFETTAMHEYGHAAGLQHEDDEYNIMGQDWTHIHCNGQTCRSYVGEDAADGLVALYGVVSSGFEDLSVTLFKYTGASGGYSQHGLCKMFSTAGAELAWASFNGQRRYNVNKGQQVKVEFTYENNGRSTQTRRAGFYLSSDSTITTADTLLATQNFTLSRDGVFTSQTTLTIPSWLTSGTTYYLGVIIDDNAGLAEVDEANNAAYHIIRVN
jgi:hypothetical protein